MGVTNKTFLFFVLVFLVTMTSCKPLELYEQTTPYPSHEWSSKDSSNYQFNITDTTAQYKIFFVIRHHNSFHYKNIWIQLKTQSPLSGPVNQSLNLQMADDQKGWLGVGMDDIYDQRIPVTPTPIQLKAGLYKFSLQHTMREDPLQGVLATGIRVEKIAL